MPIAASAAGRQLSTPAVDTLRGAAAGGIAPCNLQEDDRGLPLPAVRPSIPPMSSPVPPVDPAPSSASPRTGMGRPGRRWLIIAGVALLLVGGGAAGYLLRSTPPLPRVQLITTRAPFSAAALLADARGWFRDAGIDVTLVERPSGRNALAELTDGQSDFATAAETPIMFALLKSTPIKVVATLGISFDNTTLVGRRDRGIESSDNLPGHRVGYAPGTNSQYFLDTFLEYRGHKQDSVERIPLKPDEMLQALVDGKVDVIACWSPLNQQALATLGDNGQELRIGAIYRWSWNLVARNEELANSPVAVAMVAALMRATEEITRDPQRSARDLAPRLGMPADKLVEAWKQT